MKKICQSCGIEIIHTDHFGKNSDGTLNEDFCMLCYDDGNFNENITMDAMLELSLKELIETDAHSNISQMREHLTKLYPTLKRWRYKEKNDL